MENQDNTKSETPEKEPLQGTPRFRSTLRKMRLVLPKMPLNVRSMPSAVRSIPSVIRRMPLHLVFLAFIGFVLAAILFSFLTRASSKKMPSVTKEIEPILEEAPSEAAVVKVTQPALPQEPDVFGEVPVLSGRPEPVLILSGIIFEQGQENLALINRRVVGEGDIIAGARLEKISSDEVELNFEGKKIILRSR